MTVAVHVTHEAVKKIGGIGSVLHGLITTNTYQKHFPRTLLYTPLFHHDEELSARLGEDSKVLYSGLDKYDSRDFKKRFASIENRTGVQIVYGKKKFKNNGASTTVDIVALDIRKMKPNIIDEFKHDLWEHFCIQSDHYQHDTDYEQYLRIGIILKEIFEALYKSEENAVIFSHEYMGMPAALASVIYRKKGIREKDVTVFYAHEVFTARLMTENHQGHDISFYNILQIDRDEGISLEEEFGSQSGYARNELIKRCDQLDYIFAVGDLTKEELIYLLPKIDANKIKIVYNGTPIDDVGFSEKEKSIVLVQDYCEKLFNFRPDHIFTHVTRLVTSKAIWRDVRLMYSIDEYLARKKKKGFFVLLSTLIGDGRKNEDILKMEADYGWPVLHRENWPDLVGPEIDIYHQLEIFNSRSKAIKGLFINQFGFGYERCGKRVSPSLSLQSLRLASDIELGLSIYEPFGIAQLETLPYGGIPVVTNVCGSAFLLKETMKPSDYLIIDFTKIPSDFKDLFRIKSDYLQITKELRDLIETEICTSAASRITEILPKSNLERKKRFNDMKKRSSLLDWEHVAQRVVDYSFHLE